LAQDVQTLRHGSAKIGGPASKRLRAALS